VLQIERETFSPGVMKKVILAAVETKSFARAEAVMVKIAEVEISGRHIGRLAREHGQRLIDQQHARVTAQRKKELVVEVENAPELAVVELDGGRIRTREVGHGPGTHEPAWKETKNALFLRMSSTVHEQDPCPELPETLQNRGRIRQLALELSGSASGVEEPAEPVDEMAEPDSAISYEYEGPTKLLRTCLSSLDDITTFGPLMVAEAHRKAFFQATRQAFVADGMPCNWGVWKKHFPTFTPIGDLLHTISYVYHAAVASSGDEDFGWGHCLEWIEFVWQGRVADVITALTEWLAAQEPLDDAAPPDDPRRTVQSSLTYLTNNRSRMNYPEYRKQGLPITSSLMESLIKEIHWRVKGTEKFWNNPTGATPILTLQAAALSEDGRLDQLFA
jgi:hypothetical protein